MKAPPKHTPKAKEYTLGPLDHWERHPGDALAYDAWDILLDGVHVGRIHDHGYKPKFGFLLNPLRWMGKREHGDNATSDHRWHDGGPYDTRELALAEFVRRAEYIRKWRESLDHKGRTPEQLAQMGATAKLIREACKEGGMLP